MFPAPGARGRRARVWRRRNRSRGHARSAGAAGQQVARDVDDDAAANRRYRFLETIRHYARERLDRIRGRRAACATVTSRSFIASSGTALHTLTRPRSGAPASGECEVEQENVRAALDWGLASPGLGEKAVELAGALFWFWTKRGLFAEGRQWLERAATVPAPRVLRARGARPRAHGLFPGAPRGHDARNDAALALGSEAGDSWLCRPRLVRSRAGGVRTWRMRRGRGARGRRTRRRRPEDFSAPLLILGNIALSAVSTIEHGALRRSHRWASEEREIWGLGIILSLAAGLRIVRGDTTRPGHTRRRRWRFIGSWKTREGSPGVWTSLPVCSPRRVTRRKRRGSGALGHAARNVGGTLVPTIGWIRARYFEPADAALGERAFEAACAEGRAMQPERAIALASRRFDGAVRNRTSASVGAAMKRPVRGRVDSIA